MLDLTEIEANIDTVKRELGKRQQVYPRLVMQQKMSQEEADRHINEMLAVQKTLYSHKMLLETMIALIANAT